MGKRVNRRALLGGLLGSVALLAVGTAPPPGKKYIYRWTQTFVISLWEDEYGKHHSEVVTVGTRTLEGVEEVDA